MLTPRSLALLALALAAGAVAGGTPDEGATWGHDGTNAAGPFHITLMIQRSRLIMVMPKGTQIGLGFPVLNQDNEYDVSPALFQPSWPMISSMKFRFSPDFATVTESYVMDNKVTTVDFRRR